MSYTLTTQNKMMLIKEKLYDVFDQSCEKWENVILRKMGIDAKRIYCSICIEYWNETEDKMGRNGCNKCPLYTYVGKDCNDVNSPIWSWAVSDKKIESAMDIWMLIRFIGHSEGIL